jgi:CMP-N-acetylneuraminic acid synthetase
MIKAIAIIPAKTDSKRLKKKNLRIINNKTLVEHAIDYAKNSKLIKHIVVTTESDEVRLITKKYENIILRDREKSYMGEREVADVYVNVMQELEPQLLNGITHVVGIQPDHPDRRTKVDDLLEYVVKNKYDDLVTVNSDGTRNGAVRITKHGVMSRRVGSHLDDCTNIHSEDDLNKAEKYLSSK